MRLLESATSIIRSIILNSISMGVVGWCDGSGKLPALGRPTIWMIVGQGPIALAVGAGGGLYGHFYSPLSFLPLSGRRFDID